MTPTLDPTVAEASALGAALLDPKAADVVVARCDTDSWSRDAHRTLWQAISTLRRAGKPADTAMLTELLGRQGRLDEVGGPVGLHDLSVACPAPTHVDHYVAAVLDHARRRQLARTASALGQAAVDGSRPLHTVLTEAREQLEGIRPAGRRLTVHTDDQLDHLPPVEWLVDGLLQARALNLLFGPYKQGKSFVAIDFALSLLAGDGWHGRDTAKLDGVVYLAPEGTAGMRSRRQAWRTERGTHPKGFHVVSTPLSLLDPADVGELDQLVADTGAGLLVVDTWARSIGGDENAQLDAGEAVRALDRIRDRHGCASLVVHHVGNQDGGRARGASALPAAADVGVAVSMRGETVTVAGPGSFAKESASPSGARLMLRQAGPSAVLVAGPDGGGVEPDDAVKDRLRTVLRGRPETVIELDRLAGGRHELVEQVLEEGEFEPVDPLEVPLRYGVRSLV